MSSPSAVSDSNHSIADRIVVQAGDFIALLGRLALGVIFVTSGYGKLTNIAGFEASLAKGSVPMPSVLAWVGAIVEFVGGLMIVLGVKIRYAALLMIVFVIVATLIAHRYWEFVEPAVYQAQRSNFFKNLAILGGLLFVFLHGSGRYSVDGTMGRAS